MQPVLLHLRWFTQPTSVAWVYGASALVALAFAGLVWRQGSREPRRLAPWVIAAALLGILGAVRRHQVLPPTEFVLGQLTSQDWQDRCVALYFLERRAEQADIARITALEGDAAETHGEHWEEQTTVGRVAAAVAGAVRERLGQGSQDGDEGSSGEGE